MQPCTDVFDYGWLLSIIFRSPLMDLVAVSHLACDSRCWHDWRMCAVVLGMWLHNGQAAVGWSSQWDIILPMVHNPGTNLVVHWQWQMVIPVTTFCLMSQPIVAMSIPLKQVFLPSDCRQLFHMCGPGVWLLSCQPYIPTYTSLHKVVPPPHRWNNRLYC